MTVTIGEGLNAYQFVIRDGCRRVRPSPLAKGRRNGLAAQMDAYGLELWAGRGVFILQWGYPPVEVRTVQEASDWFQGWLRGTARADGYKAFVAYCRAVGTTHDGRPLPAWGELEQRQRDGWEAAARA